MWCSITRTVARGADSAVAEIQASGAAGRRLSRPISIDSKLLSQLASEAVEFLGGIDCLVNNSGITLNRPFLKVTPEQFDLLYHVNVRAQYFLMQHVVQDMLQHGGGAICNLTSIHGLQGLPEHSVYAGTKGRSSPRLARWAWNWLTRASASTPSLRVG